MGDVAVIDQVETPRERALARLSLSERNAYERYLATDQPRLAPQVEAQFFALYLNGKTCAEIQRLNTDFRFGSIVRARVDALWDDKREEHIASLLLTVRERVQQVQLESVEYLADMLAATHKLNGDKLKKFLQTGEESVLGEMRITLRDLKEYAKVVETLMKVTGQDRQQKVSVEGTVKHEAGPSLPAGIDLAKPITGSMAAKLLTLHAEKKEK